MQTTRSWLSVVSHSFPTEILEQNLSAFFIFNCLHLCPFLFTSIAKHFHAILSKINIESLLTNDSRPSSWENRSKAYEESGTSLCQSHHPYRVYEGLEHRSKNWSHGKLSRSLSKEGEHGNIYFIILVCIKNNLIYSWRRPIHFLISWHLLCPF